MESPYRSAVAQEELEAQTSLGGVRLQVAPKHTRLELGDEVWTIANDQLTVVTPRNRRRPKKRSLVLRGAHLYVARAWPTNEISLWLEPKPGIVQRVLGLPPLPGISQETMREWRALETLAASFESALASYGRGARAFELGQGQHRVFALHFDERIVVYARPVFRERPRRLIEVAGDNSLVLVRGKRERKQRLEGGMEVIATGDHIQFCHPDGELAASIYLPWISPADRVELGRRLQALVVGGRGRGRDSDLSLNAQLSLLSPTSS